METRRRSLENHRMYEIYYLRAVLSECRDAGLGVRPGTPHGCSVPGSSKLGLPEPNYVEKGSVNKLLGTKSDSYHVSVMIFTFHSSFPSVPLMMEKELANNGKENWPQLTAKSGLRLALTPNRSLLCYTMLLPLCMTMSRTLSSIFPRCDALTSGITLVWNVCWNSDSQTPSRPRAPGALAGPGTCVLTASTDDAYP